MTWLGAVLTSPLTEAIGWGLVHLLWQGALLGLITAAALKLIEQQPSSLRYLVACSSLVLLSTLPIATAIHLYNPGPVATPGEPAVSTVANSPTTLDVLVSELSRELRGDVAVPLRTRISREIGTLLPWLVAFWMAGVAFLSTRLLFGWFRAQRFTQGATEAPHRWQRSLNHLSARLGLTGSISLLQSARVHVPMVVGWLRPVVLVPATALTGLSAEQLETILAHELAHIRRHDYLVNLLQSVVETLFFYHPAVWWLSNRIRVERENCCDDMAVGVCGDPLLFARALTELEALRSVTLSQVVAINGGTLRDRVLRLLSAPSPRCSYRWVTGLSIVSTLAAVAVVMPISLFAYQRMSADPSTTAVSSSGTAPEIVAATPETPVPSPDQSVNVVASPIDSPAAEQSEYESTQIVIEETDENDPAFAIAPSAPMPPMPPMPPVPPMPPGRTPFPPVAPSARTPAMPPVPMIPALALAPRIHSPTPRVPMTAQLAPSAPMPPMPAIPPAPSIYMVGPAGSSYPALAPVAGRIGGRRTISQTPRPGTRSKERWNGELTIDQLIALRNAGVDPKFITSLRELGYGELSLDDLISLRIQGVTPEFISQIKTHGFGHLSADQLVNLRVHGVTPVYLDSLSQLGFGNPSLSEIVNLRIHGVTTEYAQAMKAAGLATLSAKDLIDLRIQGVNPEFLRDLTSAGYDELKAHDVVELKVQGVTGEWIRSLKDAGFENLTVRDLVRLRVSGIDSSFLREMKQYRKK